MAEQDISFTDNAFAHNTGKNDRLCEPSKTSFFRFDKNYRPRECNKTKKVLLLSQTANISAVTNETLYLCDICKKKKKKKKKKKTGKKHQKKKKLQSGLKRHRKNCTQPTRMISSILLHRWKTHPLKIVNRRSPQDLKGGHTKNLNL